MKTVNIIGKEFLEVELEDLLECEILPDAVEIDDWPYGRRKRCIMKFSIETKGNKQRMVKQSIFNGRPNKPKRATYASRVFLIKIDEKIGRVEFAKNYSMVSVYMEDSRFTAKTFHTDIEFQTLADHYGV